MEQPKPNLPSRASPSWLTRLIVGATASVVLWTAADARGQSFVLDEDRKIDWVRAGIPGGIPDRKTVCATLNPDATAAQINSAIAQCGGGVVQLNTGIYNLSSGITFGKRSGVTLRGAGPEQTTLRFSASDPCAGLKANVCIHGASTVWSGNVPVNNVR